MAMVTDGCAELSKFSQPEEVIAREYWKPHPFKPLLEREGVFINSRGEIRKWADLEMGDTVLLTIDEVNQGQAVINRCKKW